MGCLFGEQPPAGRIWSHREVPKGTQAAKRQRWQDHERVLAGEGSSSEMECGHRGNVWEEKQKLPMAK